MIKKKTSPIWVYEKTKKHKLKIRKPQDVEAIKAKVIDAKYQFKSKNTNNNFQITMEFANNPDSQKIKQEIREVLKREFLDNFLKSSGQSQNTALSSPLHLDKEEIKK